MLYIIKKGVPGEFMCVGLRGMILNFVLSLSHTGGHDWGHGSFLWTRSAFLFMKIARHAIISTG
jgi:hypothetical protein